MRTIGAVLLVIAVLAVLDRFLARTEQDEVQGAARHVVADIDLRVFGGSALTDDIDVPHHESADDLGEEIPVTYVPARNTVFLSFALAWAETLEASDVFIGVNALDYSGYPDCRPEYISAFEQMANLATKAGVEGRQHLRIHAPLIELTKAQIIQQGLALGVDYSLTHSCYDPDAAGRACGTCDSCLLRLRGEVGHLFECADVLRSAVGVPAVVQRVHPDEHVACAECLGPRQREGQDHRVAGRNIGDRDLRA